MAAKAQSVKFNSKATVRRIHASTNHLTHGRLSQPFQALCTTLGHAVISESLCILSVVWPGLECDSAYQPLAEGAQACRMGGTDGGTIRENLPELKPHDFQVRVAHNDVQQTYLHEHRWIFPAWMLWRLLEHWAPLRRSPPPHPHAHACTPLQTRSHMESFPHRHPLPVLCHKSDLSNGFYSSEWKAGRQPTATLKLKRRHWSK